MLAQISACSLLGQFAEKENTAAIRKELKAITIEISTINKTT
jgi:hypothetical protein